jgi:coatomer protein complex subunit gamma
LHSANSFNDKNINPGSCIDILVNLIYLINQGETFSKQEKETLFFAVTKLTHSTDILLRRVIFLFLRHLQFDSSFSFILTGTLINEIQKSDTLKPISFRIVGQILDVTNIQNIERELKNVNFV